MIVINKKRLSIILSCIFLGLFAFSFQVANYNNKENVNQTVVETTSTPVSDKIIVIDAGHGVPDEGVSLLH